MPHSLPHIITQIRASGRTTTHGAILLAEVDRLRALVDSLTVDGADADPQADADTLLAAIQAHHDTKHPRGAAVLAPVDRALYTAAGIEHAVLGWSEGLDERRRAPAPVAGDV